MKAKKNKKKRQWVTIPDGSVRQIWQCKNDECLRPNCFALSPKWYTDNGTPVCEECDRDMVYIRTEILK